MKKEMSGPVIGAIIALVIVLIGGMGWYMLNRDTMTINPGKGSKSDDSAAKVKPRGGADVPPPP